MRRHFIWSFFFFIFISPAFADSNSYNVDCSSSKTAIEKLICSNPSLHDADQKMSDKYGNIIVDRSDEQKSIIKKSQINWIILRDKICSGDKKSNDEIVECLNNETEQRLSFLNSIENQEAPLLEKNIFKGNPKQETLLHVFEFGRYAIWAKSPFGTNITLVDRKSGSLENEGVVGKKDGRIDLFLEKGDYKIILNLPEETSKPAYLYASKFRELEKEPKELNNARYLETTLPDMTTRSWWLNLENSETVNIEVAGRTLSELRLWKDGKWITSDVPQSSIIEPKTGQPLKLFSFNTRIEKGLYLLSAYGGEPLDWVENAEKTPLYVRTGIEALGKDGKMSDTTSPFGFNRFKVPKYTKFFRLELDKPRNAKLSVVDTNYYSPQNRQLDNVQEITNKSRFPLAEINSYSNSDKIVIVEQEAGLPYTLQHFEERDYANLAKNKHYFIQAMRSGYAEDNADMTTIITNQCKDNSEVVIGENLIVLDKKQKWRRRFNLTRETELFIHIKDNGDYIPEAEEIDNARFLFEPFITSHFKDYTPPKSKTSGETWTLNVGYYRLKIKPDSKENGIIDLSLRNKDAKKQKEYSPVISSLLLPDFYTDDSNDCSISIYANNVPQLSTGFDVRERPLNISSPIFLTLDAKSSLMLPVMIPEKGILTAANEDRSPAKMSINNEKWFSSFALNKGVRTLYFKNDEEKPISIQLSHLPDRLSSNSPLPTIDTAALQNIPNIPDIKADETIFTDINQGETKTWNIEVEKPALYVTETTGLLSTTGKVRTRTNASLASANQNGVGRNFLLSDYLLSGTYQVSVNSNGKSQGHLGMHIKTIPIRNIGNLIKDIPIRTTMKQEEAVSYTFDIEKEGMYNLESIGLGQVFTMRIEDADGWPIEKTGISSDLTRFFEKGTYKVILLPLKKQSRVVSLLKEILPPEQPQKGRGPFKLSLGKAKHHTWLEPNKEGKTDNWEFSLTASADVTINLDKIGLTANIKNKADDRDDDWNFVFARNLPKGFYKLKIDAADGTSGKTNVSLHIPKILSKEELDLNNGVIFTDNFVHEYQVKAPDDDALLVLSADSNDSLAMIVSDDRGNELANKLDKNPIIIPHNEDCDIKNYNIRLWSTARSGAKISLNAKFIKSDFIEENDINDGNIIFSSNKISDNNELYVASVKTEQAGMFNLANLPENILFSNNWGKSLEIVKNNLLSVNNNVFWLAVSAKTPPQVKINWVNLSDNNLVLSVDVPMNNIINIEPTAKKHITIASVKSIATNVGIAAVTKSKDELNLKQTGFAEHYSIAVLEGDTQQSITVWNADNINLAQRVEIKKQVFELNDNVREYSPLSDINIASGKTERLNLNGVFQKIDLALPPETAAIFTKNNEPVKVLWSGEAPKSMSLSISADEAIFANMGKDEASLSVSLKALNLKNVYIPSSIKGFFGHGSKKYAANIYKSIDSTTVFTRFMNNAGITVVDLNLTDNEKQRNLRLKVEGDEANVIVLQKNGEIVQGNNIAIKESGIVMLSHNKGYVAAWIENGENNPFLSEKIHNIDVDKNQFESFPLFGRSTSFNLSNKKPQLMHFSINEPCLIHIEFDKKQSITKLISSNGKISEFLPEGKHSLYVFSLTPDTELSGTASLSFSDPLEITEGLGSPMRLLPEDARLFTFKLEKETTLGLGINASPDIVRTILFDTAGKELGEGIVQMRHNLPAGRYYLLAYIPSGEKTAMIKPALVGLMPPEMPPEIISRYKNLEENKE